MPELPEVETIKADLNIKIPGLTIEKIDVFDDRVIKDLSKEEFASQLIHKQIKSVNRRGKALILSFESGGYCVVQLKMTGQLIYEKAPPRSKDTKISFRLSNGNYLNYNDQRMFGWFIIIDDLNKVPFLQFIGPEPLEESFNVQWLKVAVRSRKAPIKNLLMNQHFVAGIGNIYASEILFGAKINPKRQARRLTRKELISLYKCTVAILRKAIQCRGTSMRNYRDSSGQKGKFKSRIKVYGRENEKCSVCRTPIKRIVQSGRSTFFCKLCQQ